VTDYVQKQVVAVIDDRTTRVCLHAAGMIVPVDHPFQTLAGDFMAPPFHVHCRSIMRPWMSGFLKDTRKAANAELSRRPMKERRLGPGGEIGARIPPPYDWNQPVDYTFPGARRASYYPPVDSSVHFATGEGLETRTPTKTKMPRDVPDWGTLAARIDDKVIDKVVKSMVDRVFTQEEVDYVWELLLELVKTVTIRTLADLPAKLRRLLGL
jgi:hypothetical protein